MTDVDGRHGVVPPVPGAPATPAPPSMRIRWMRRAVDVVTCTLALGPLTTVLGDGATPVQAVCATLGAITLGVLGSYHLRLLGGGRRRGPAWATLAPMVLASYGLMPVLGSDWYATPAFLLGAVVAAVPWARAWPFAAAIVVGEPILAVLTGHGDGAVYGTIQVALSGAVLYGFARAIATAQELARLREELATVAVVAERLRVSRDLHDLLGRSLAAIGLKAELALRYQEQGSDTRVREELSEIVELAHQSGADLRELVSGYRRLTLEQEVRAGRDLLERNAVRCTVDLGELPELPRPVDQVLAFTVREAVTNILRHSIARDCVIEASLEEGVAALLVRNDGVSGPQDGSDGGRTPAFTAAGSGTGLMGIAERAAAMGGSSRARKQRDGWFEVAVRVPLPAGAGGDGVGESVAGESGAGDNGAVVSGADEAWRAT